MYNSNWDGYREYRNCEVLALRSRYWHNMLLLVGPVVNLVGLWKAVDHKL
jgi:uncharacterized membrane protein YiaA